MFYVKLGESQYIYEMQLGESGGGKGISGIRYPLHTTLNTDLQLKVWSLIATVFLQSNGLHTRLEINRKRYTKLSGASTN